MCRWRARAPFSEKLALISARLPGTSSAPPIPLQAPRDNQLPDVGRQSAPCRGSREEHDAGGEDLAAAVAISQRSANEQQRRQEKRIGFHHPLNLGQRRAQGRLQRRQRHVHHRAIDERHARTEDGRRQNPAAVRGSRLLAGTGEYRGFIAGRSGDGWPYSILRGNRKRSQYVRKHPSRAWMARNARTNAACL